MNIIINLNISYKISKWSVRSFRGQNKTYTFYTLVKFLPLFMPIFYNFICHIDLVFLKSMIVHMRATKKLNAESKFMKKKSPCPLVNHPEVRYVLL